MKIIEFEQKYENEVVDLWNECCYFDNITLEKFRNQAVFDENFDTSLCLLALEKNKVVGFILATKRQYHYVDRGLEPEKAWINVIFVAKDFRNQGIGEMLYRTAEDRLIAKGAKTIILAAYSPNYFFGGLDEEHYPEAASFFLKMGFVPGEKHVSMGKDLHGYQIPDEVKKQREKALAKGFRFLPFEYRYALDLLNFLGREFGGSWRRHALLSMKNGTADDRIVIVLDGDGKICGSCLRAIDGNPMRFGPIGIAEKYRDQGLGTILLDEGCYEMSKKGIYRMFFMTTTEQAQRYYERNGLSVIRTCVDYRKQL